MRALFPTSAAAIALCLMALAAGSAAAQTPMTGGFVAEARCPALQSIRRASNPGAIATEPGQTYRLVGRNAEKASHYFIEVPGARPERRWVAVGCGRLEAGEKGSAEAAVRGAVVPPAEVAERISNERGSARPPDQAAGDGAFVLAASWHAAFCETASRLPECRVADRTRAETTRFSLHGLWPGRRGTEYCGVGQETVAVDRAGRWRELPALDLSPQTRGALGRAMPGARAGLDRHEWIKHGNCYGGADAEEYFADALVVLDALNASRVQAMFAGALGQYLSDRLIRRAFDRSFGKGAGSRVAIVCVKDGQRTLIVELRIWLKGEIRPDGDVGRLIVAAPPVEDPGCRGGTVDEVGLQ